MRISEVAIAKDVSQKTVRRWLKRGLKAIRRSHCDVEITPDALTRFEEQQTKKWRRHDL